MDTNHQYNLQNEEAPVNSAGAGAVAGIGVSNSEKGENFGEPGRKKKDQLPILRRRQIWVKGNTNG